MFALSLISILAVYSSTGTLAYKYRAGNVAYYLFKHVSFLFLGFLIIYFYTWCLTRFFPVFRSFSLYFNSVVGHNFGFGTSLNQASRWLTLPGTGLTFQTSDLAKIALIMYLARLLSLKQDTIKTYKKGFCL